MHRFLIILFMVKATTDKLGYASKMFRQAPTIGNTGRGFSNSIETGHEQFITNINMLADAFSSGLAGFHSGYNYNDNDINTDNNDEFDTDTTTSSEITNTADIGIKNNYNTGKYDRKPVDAKVFEKFYGYKAPNKDNFSQANIAFVFTKAPENQAFTNSAVRLAKQASVDRTGNYVLTKQQTDAAELANRLQTIKSNHNGNKPEVHFVKYRTLEDAVLAQQAAIQAQYDALGSPKLSSNAGVASLLAFLTAANAGVGSGVAGNEFLIGHAINGGTVAYLPPVQIKLQ